MIGYKLMKVRKDGSLGPLFINARQRVPIGEWLEAEDHKTNGYAHRPGWHILDTPYAPHLKKTPNRVWVIVEYENAEQFQRPNSQGGIWFLAKRMKVERIADGKYKF